MPYVNHGGAQNMDNCAMCTIAAIIGQNMTTAQVAQTMHAAGQSDDDLANALGHGALDGMAQLQAVLNSMIGYIKQLKAHLGAPVTGYQFGVPGIGKTAVQTNAYVTSKPVGSQFAVWGCQAHIIMGFGAHWNYARHTPAGVVYQDYQDNNANGAPIAASPAFIQPRGPSRVGADVYDNFLALWFN